MESAIKPMIVMVVEGPPINSQGTIWRRIPCAGRIRLMLSEITKLPVSVGGLVPHEGPMLLVDRLIKIGERTAEVETTVRQDMPFVDDKGFLDEVAYLEIIAQAMAAMKGFEQHGRSKRKPEGFLLGARILKS